MVLSVSMKKDSSSRPQQPATTSTQLIDIYDRSKLRRMIIKLATASGQMPRTLYLHDVKLFSRDSVKGGAFADIYKGTCRSQEVAVKRLRFFMSQTEEARISNHKVYPIALLRTLLLS